MLTKKEEYERRTVSIGELLIIMRKIPSYRERAYKRLLKKIKREMHDACCGNVRDRISILIDVMKEFEEYRVRAYQEILAYKATNDELCTLIREVKVPVYQMKAAEKILQQKPENDHLNTVMVHVPPLATRALPLLTV